ncbi:MAG TPA: glycosyltransferase family 1 protein [bacterium]|nr:glycosyltransferase family 1 protein [bacterium]
MTKKILHVVNRMDIGGVEVWLMNVLRNIDRDKYHFIFCCLSDSQGCFDEEIRSLGAEMISCSLNEGYRKFTKNFKKILKDIKPDIVHSHLHFFSGYILKLASKNKIPMRIVHSHLAGDMKAESKSLKRNIYKWLMRKRIRKYATHGVGCSDMAADYLFSLKWRNISNYMVATCAIDTEPFKESVDRELLLKEFDIPANSKIIGHVGSFGYQKNHEFLLCIIAALLEKRQDIYCILIGEGPLKSQIESLVNQMGIAGHVTFAGARNDVPILMSNLFDLFLFPSRFEGLPITLMEAQCAGLVSVISDSITSEVKIIDQLVKFESLNTAPNIWADKISELLMRPAYDKNLAIKRIEESHFGIKTNVKFLSKLYSGDIC